jgi:hypothetical protein
LNNNDFFSKIYQCLIKNILINHLDVQKRAGIAVNHGSSSRIALHHGNVPSLGCRGEVRRCCLHQPRRALCPCGQIRLSRFDSLFQSFNPALDLFKVVLSAVDRYGQARHLLPHGGNLDRVIILYTVTI